MTAPSQPEAWLRGPLPGFAPEVMPAAHALVQAREDLDRALAGVTDAELWTRPGAAASAGYHLKHLAGSLDRLLTYARGEPLSPAQRAALADESVAGGSAAELLGRAEHAIGRALEQLRRTPADTLQQMRPVGRAALPATAFGLIFHAAEHTTRHVGQIITTLKVVRGTGGSAR
jgi:uncharacterized damage-inducible protein DinB